jgi:hypothetical protein
MVYPQTPFRWPCPQRQACLSIYVKNVQIVVMTRCSKVKVGILIQRANPDVSCEDFLDVGINIRVRLNAGNRVTR